MIGPPEKVVNGGPSVAKPIAERHWQENRQLVFIIMAQKESRMKPNGLQYIAETGTIVVGKFGAMGLSIDFARLGLVAQDRHSKDAKKRTASETSGSTGRHIANRKASTHAGRTGSIT